MSLNQAKPLIARGVAGPVSAVDNEVPVFDGITGRKIKAVPGLTITVNGDVCTVAIAKDVLVNLLGASDESLTIQQTLDVVSSLIASGDLYVAEKIEHKGDGNTYIRFTDDQIDLYAGGRKMLSLDEGAQDKGVFNPDKYNVDFILYGENKSLVYADANSDSLSFGGGFGYYLKKLTSTYTTTYADHLLICDGTFTVNLNSPGVNGQELIIKNSGTGTITVDAYGAHTIDGALTQTLTQYQSITIIAEKVSDAWHIIADNR